MYMCIYRVFLFKWSCPRIIKNRQRQQVPEVYASRGFGGMLPWKLVSNLVSLRRILMHSEGRVVTN